MASEKTAQQYFNELVAYCATRPDVERALVAPWLGSLEKTLEWVDPEIIRLTLEGARENDKQKILRATDMMNKFSASLALQRGNPDADKGDA